MHSKKYLTRLALLILILISAFFSLNGSGGSGGPEVWTVIAIVDSSTFSYEDLR